MELPKQFLHLISLVLGGAPKESIKGAFKSAFYGAILCLLTPCSHRKPYEEKSLTKIARPTASEGAQISSVKLDGSARRYSSGTDR